MEENYSLDAESARKRTLFEKVGTTAMILNGVTGVYLINAGEQFSSTRMVGGALATVAIISLALTETYMK